MIRRVVGKPDPNVSLLEQILSTNNVRLAWAQVRANRGSPGIDEVTVDEFPETFRSQWKEIKHAILPGK